MIGARAALVALAFAGVALAPAAARAYERQHHVGVGGGLAMLRVDAKPTLSVGAGGIAHYAYGLTDAINLVAEGGWAKVALEEEITPANPTRNRPTDVWHAGVGATYSLDVIRWVPYVGGLATVYDFTGGSLPKAKPVLGAQLAVGVDYMIDRSWGIGVGLRQHFPLGAFATYTSYTSIFARAEYVWGW